jgi:hypothetical protein
MKNPTAYMRIPVTNMVVVAEPSHAPGPGRRPREGSHRVEKAISTTASGIKGTHTRRYSHLAGPS